MKHLTTEEQESLQQLGKTVQNERLKLGVNVVDMAHDAGLSHQTLYRIEAGEGANIVAFLRLAEAMGINVTRFFISFF